MHFEQLECNTRNSCNFAASYTLPRSKTPQSLDGSYVVALVDYLSDCFHFHSSFTAATTNIDNDQVLAGYFSRFACSFRSAPAVG